MPSPPAPCHPSRPPGGPCHSAVAGLCDCVRRLTFPVVFFFIRPHQACAPWLRAIRWPMSAQVGWHPSSPELASVPPRVISCPMSPHLYTALPPGLTRRPCHRPAVPRLVGACLVSPSCPAHTRSPPEAESTLVSPPADLPLAPPRGSPGALPLPAFAWRDLPAAALLLPLLAGCVLRS